MTRNFLSFVYIPFLFSICAFADPIDTGYDLLHAIEYQDGYAIEGLFSEDLYNTFISFFDQLRALAEADMTLVKNLVQQKYGDRLEATDLLTLSNEEIFSLLFSNIYLQPETQIEQESAILEGRTASVIFRYFDGSTISFLMVWENSSWKISDTSLLMNFI